MHMHGTKIFASHKTGISRTHPNYAYYTKYDTTEPANLAPVRENSMFCYGPQVSELGGPRVHGAPP